MLVLGGSGWTATACAAVARFAERFALPVATSFRRAALFDATHPNYAGEIGIGPNPKLKARIAGADLLLLVGGRMAEMPSQSYTLLDIPLPRQKFVHVHGDASEIGRVYHPALGIHAAPKTFAASLEAMQPPNEIGWPDATPRPAPITSPGPRRRRPFRARSTWVAWWPGCAGGYRPTRS